MNDHIKRKTDEHIALIDAFLRQLEELIDRAGHAVVCVPDSKTYPYSYSVGRAEQGKSELAVLGFDEETARHVINMCAADMDRTNIALTDSQVIEVGNLRFKIVEARSFQFLHGAVAKRRALAKNCDETMTFHQILVPDANNLLQDEEGFDESLRQVVFAHVRDAAVTRHN